MKKTTQNSISPTLQGLNIMKLSPRNLTHPRLSYTKRTPSIYIYIYIYIYKSFHFQNYTIHNSYTIHLNQC
jgi:hypothetical protein